MHILLEELLGWTSLLIIFIFVFIYSKKDPHVKNIILVAFFLRTLIIILEQYGIIIVPDGNSTPSDANQFELIARLWSSGTMFPFADTHPIYKEKGFSVLLDFFEKDSLLIARIISIFYTIFGESIMMAKSISLALALASVYMLYILSLEIWNRESALKAAWVFSLFPSFILYSVITLREIYVIFFLLISLIGIAKYLKKKSFTSFLQIAFGFYFSSLFHGPVAVGFFVFLLYLIIDIAYKQFLKLKFLKINLIPIFFIIIFFIPIFLLFNNSIKLTYLGSFESLTNIEYLLHRANIGFNGLASYPSWLIIDNINEIFPKTLVKVIYFLYSPFVWDIKQYSHIIGFFDGTLYIILTIYLCINWKNIWSSPITRVFLLIFISYIIIYGFGLGNFGTALRHRSKFLIILIVLAAPKIHKFIFSSTKKIYK